MGEASANLQKLRPVTFCYKPEVQNDARQLQYGLIAEEVAAVYQRALSTARNDAAQ